MEYHRVVITGMGAVTPLGLTLDETWTAAKAGKCGIGPITLYDCSEMKVKLAGEVRGFQPEQFMEKREVRKNDRCVQFAIAASREALAMSGLDMEAEDPCRCAVILATGIGGIATIQADTERAHEKGYDKISPFFIPMTITNMAAAQVAIKFGFRGMCTCPVSACAAGANAVGDAMRHLRHGYADVALCGGAEAAITALGMGGFTSMHALTDSADPMRASIPFDAERSGFVMGEGAGVLVLETLEHATGRGAAILGEVVGYGATCDAYHITAPDPEGKGGAEAMAQALRDAGIQPKDVDYINAHGTSTPLNDKCETLAIKTAFGEHAYRLAVSSTKSMTGHLLGASGGVEAILCARALEEGFVPPTIGYRKRDDECDLDIVPNKGRKAALQYAVSNSLGFG
ncbi:MAG: beta-ketoacyl-[acyl-carrier-protein] synthase II, partial [Clostridia bacterium]|nr:beta-ketoacyl-[acyl-carrier-protein] synthase II [Clostridia bacterium]